MRMAAAMLLTLPGQPFIYYGEELGMRGRKPDEDLREPMRWDRKTDAPGEATWKASTAHDGPTVSVEAEQADPDSLLHYYTTLIHWRSKISALRDGAIHPINVANPHIAAWKLDDTTSHVLVIHNLSGAAQSMSLDAPGAMHFREVLHQTGTGAEIRNDSVELPPYSSVILQ
jgi:glycosidase